MIQSVSVKNLFGLYNYNIPFLIKPAIKILTGPNGYGKSTILMAIHNLYKGNFWFFHFLDFEAFSIYIADYNNAGETISKLTIDIIKEPVSKDSVEGMSISDNVADDTDRIVYQESFILKDSNSVVIEKVVIGEDYIDSILSLCRRKTQMADQYKLSDEELLTRYYDIDEDSYIQKNCRNFSLALQEYETIYLPAHRMFPRVLSGLSFRYRRYSHEIDRVNQSISMLYRDAQNMFAAASQRIDATFIKRLYKGEVQYTKEELKIKLDDLKRRIDRYKKLNLINDMQLLDYSLDVDLSDSGFDKVLSLYVDDMNEKMNCFENLYNKISLYKEVITKMTLSEKTIDFSDNGLTVTNAKGRILSDLHKLSSGEQNLLILYFNLIFKSNGKTILLIDEPENSLHVAWQSKMLDDYIKMTESTGCQIILATHSPTLIRGKWHLTTDLYKQYKGID